MKFAHTRYDNWFTDETSITKDRQDLNYFEALTYGTNPDLVVFAKFRIKIKSNAYRMQSWAYMQRWDGKRWREVATLSPGEMQTQKGLYQHKHASDADCYLEFTQDRDHLIERTTTVIGAS